MPLDVAVEKTLENAEDGQFMAIVHRLPESEKGIFTERHLEALRRACASLSWSKHPVDIRLSIPTLFRRYYVAVVAGPERRAPERRSMERQRHPLAGVGNILFIGGLALLAIYAAILIETMSFIAYYKLLGA